MTRAALTFAAALMCACTPTVHHLAPYRSDTAAADALERRARTVCMQARGVTPPRHFTTDGCSIWPDDGWVRCCIEHDIAYWCGGSAEARDRADDAFRACMRSEGGACLSTFSYVGVRVGGPPWMPFPWRWGYGWDWLEDPR